MSMKNSRVRQSVHGWVLFLGIKSVYDGYNYKTKVKAMTKASASVGLLLTLTFAFINGIFCDWWRGYSRNVSLPFTMEHEHFFKTLFLTQQFQVLHSINLIGLLLTTALNIPNQPYIARMNDPSSITPDRKLYNVKEYHNSVYTRKILFNDWSRCINQSTWYNSVLVQQVLVQGLCVTFLSSWPDLDCWNLCSQPRYHIYGLPL